MTNKTEILWDDHNSVAPGNFSQGRWGIVSLWSVSETHRGTVLTLAPSSSVLDSSQGSAGEAQSWTHTIHMPWTWLDFPHAKPQGSQVTIVLHYWIFMLISSVTCQKGIWFCPVQDLASLGQNIFGGWLIKEAVPSRKIRAQKKKVIHFGNCLGYLFFSGTGYNFRLVQ